MFLFNVLMMCHIIWCLWPKRLWHSCSADERAVFAACRLDMIHSTLKILFEKLWCSTRFKSLPFRNIWESSRNCIAICIGSRLASCHNRGKIHAKIAESDVWANHHYVTPGSQQSVKKKLPFEDREHSVGKRGLGARIGSALRYSLQLFTFALFLPSEDGWH